MISRLRAVVREPLVHFLLVGGALFALDALARGTPSAPGAAPEEPRRVVVTRAVADELAAAFRTEHDRAPSPAELDAAVARWVDDEILYREGRRRGLERDDPRTRARVASRMAFVLRAQSVIPEPSDRELRAWLAAHADRFAVPERIDFTHVFVRGDDEVARARAHELLGTLTAGASPTRLGDTFSGGRHYRGRTVRDLSATFGEAFALGVREQREGTWALHVSRFGQHVVRVEGRTVATATADFASLRADVRHDWLEARRDRETRAAIAKVRARWEIVRER
ncbi:MAG: peptidyl-prolyl cis-trans isomerase [Deltaproteobacteria bacterium]|nr:peptidyl-prolyl cis-trans isomerase [Deltaproteobacteria bacterium]